MRSVAIITRTKNRPLMLRRTLSDISRQTFKDFVWVVVNDGGDPAPVEAIVGKSREGGIDAVLIHHPASLGAPAASNSGVRRSRSEFLVLHDDDDTWEPAFLEETVGFLRSEQGARSGGVVTHSNQVLEEMVGETLSIISIRPYNSGIKNMHISHMCRGCLFPPISFLYRREFFDTIGGYEGDLPLHDDWIFYLKFLLHGDIGLIPKLLADRHLRVNAGGEDYANFSASNAQLSPFEASVRNRFLREDLQSGGLGLGSLLFWGRNVDDLYWGMNRLVKAYSIGSFIRRKLGLKESCP